MALKQGSIVLSNCGRDKEKYFLVVKVEDEFVYLCDGKVRKVSNPKKKKIKHVEETEFFSESMSQKISKGETLLDNEVQKEIRALIYKEE